MDGPVPSWQRYAEEQEAETRAEMEKLAKREEYNQGDPGEDMVLLAAGVYPAEAALSNALWELIASNWKVILLVVLAGLVVFGFLRWLF